MGYFRESFTPESCSFCCTKEQQLFLEWNVTRIQAWWRSRCCVHDFHQLKEAAHVLQARWRQYLRSPVFVTKKTIRFMNLSARRIQRSWRSYKDKRIFRYYKELITNTENVHPTLLLRRINPAEAKLADSAAGLHIRFRLAGTSFPPSLLYKLYTHRPVVDMGAFSPRKYSVTLRRPGAGPCKFFHQPLEQITDGYIRYENNEWRLVCGNPCIQSLEDVIPSAKEPEKFFQPSRAARKKSKAESRRKKRAWLQKMYREGCLTGPEPAEPPKDPAKLDEDDMPAIELFLWTLGLNFNAYESDWRTLATSCVFVKN